MTFTTEQFLKDVEKHQIQIIHDDGVYRHIRFKDPDTICMYFDLVTWPGFLAYSGDMGAYMFTRTHDMFEFFRRREDKLFQIDMRYCAEKCEASDKHDGIREFSKEKFKQRLTEYINDREAEDQDNPDDSPHYADSLKAAYAELREAVEDEVFGCDDNGIRAYDAANDFTHSGEAWRHLQGENAIFEFQDVWEMNFDEYTQRFQWCCHALAWGINQYDKVKQQNEKPVEQVPQGSTGSQEAG